MNSAPTLYELFARSARSFPHRTAVEEAEGASIRYSELAELSERLAGWLQVNGVVRGERVGIYLPKSIDSVAAIIAALRIGAAYVPLDPLAPAGRNAYILQNCGVRAVVAERRLAEAVRPELEPTGHMPPFLSLDKVGGGAGVQLALERGNVPSYHPTPIKTEPSDLAYILYTSGSTGLPKGVMLTHQNALCFVNWCSDVFEPSAEDRFSSHAPFHFDLSILDVYLPLKHGATVVLIGERQGKEPLTLARIIAEKQISVWYSAPSILSMLVEQGRLDEHDAYALRLVLFAGEVFPVKYLRALKGYWQQPRYFNLYGPTETNVCTWYEVPPVIPPDRLDPYPIGQVCQHYRELVIDHEARKVPEGAEGELCIAGSGVMQGYWGLPEQNDHVFLSDSDGTKWYRTGDIVVREPEGNYRFLGRRDRMIKKRGYRVELGEIEAALYRHPEVKEAAVIAHANDAGTHVRAFLSTKNGARLSIIALKQFCAGQLPLYMVPDTFSFLDALPKTSTDKIAYQILKEME